MKLRYENFSINRIWDVPIYTNKDGNEFILKKTYTKEEDDYGAFKIVMPRCGGHLLIHGGVDIGVNARARSFQAGKIYFSSVEFYHQDFLSYVSFDMDYSSYDDIVPENFKQVLSDLVEDCHYIDWDAEEMPTIHQMKKEGY